MDRLPDEKGSVWQISHLGSCPAGGDQDLNILANPSYSLGHLKAIYTPLWHFDIGDNSFDAGKGSQDSESFIRMTGLDHLEPCVFQHIHKSHSNKNFILHNKNKWTRVGPWLGHVARRRDQDSWFHV